MKILVADDQRLWRQSLEDLLGRWGYEVHCARNGAEAWQALQADPSIALLMTDWVMPEIDGLELCRRARALKRERYLPVLLMTSREGREDLAAGLNAGADAFLRKPLEENELLAQIRVAERILHLEERLDSRIGELRRATQRLERDLEDAAAIQRSLLPIASPRLPGVQVAWHYEACKQLGGDMFNAFPLDAGHVGLYVLDVSGHGTSAALQSVGLSRVLNPFPQLGGILTRPSADGAGVSLASPHQVAHDLNQSFQILERSGQYFTFLYGVLELASRRFRFVRAGHPGPIVVSGGRARIHDEGGGIPIGVVDDARYSDEEIELRSGDSMLLFTDGVNETLDPEGAEFGMQRLLDTAARANGRIESTVESLRRALDEHRKTEPRRDDVTVVGLRVD